MPKDQPKILSRKPLRHVRVKGGFREFEPDENIKVDRITYQGVGFDYPDVEGIIAKPSGAKEKSLPLIIFNTPGTRMMGGHADHESNIYGYAIPYASSIGKNGAIVVSSSLRKKDEYGGADVSDVLDIMEIGKQQPEWDGRNVIMIGFSRGAMMTYLAIKEGAKLTGAVIAAGETDLYAGEAERTKADGNSDIKDQNTTMIPELKEQTPEEERKEILESRSAVYWPEKLVDTPMLILHGAEDKAVALHHAADMDEALTKEGSKNHTLRIVDEECWISKEDMPRELGVCQHGVLKAENSNGEFFVEKEVIGWCNQSIERVNKLFQSVKTGNINDFIRIASTHGIHPANIRDEYGKNLLHNAAFYGQIDMFKYLVKQGIDPSHISDNGMTPMHEAAYKGHIDMFKFLAKHYKHQLKPDTKDIHGRTALRYAVRNGKVVMAEYLMNEYGLDPNEVDSNKRTLFSYAVEGGHIEMVDCLEYAITKGNPDITSPCARLEGGKKTLLHYAAFYGQIEMFDHLVATYGLNPEQTDDNGIRPMHEAAHKGHTAMVAHLASHYHLDVTVRDLRGATPMDYANGNGKIKTAGFIENLAAKARIRSLDALDLSTTVPISQEFQTKATKLGAKVSTVPNDRKPEQSFAERMQSTTPRGSQEI